MRDTIDLSQTPPFAVVEELDYESILADRKAALVAHFPPDDRGEVEETVALESEPLAKVLQENAEREMLLRKRINEAARATALPYAIGADLDVVATRYNVQRLLIQPAQPDATPPIPAIYEADADLRQRCLLSLEGLSAAGPAGAYEFHALSASGDVLDASVDAPRFAVESVDHEARTITWSIEYDAGLDEPRPGDVVVSVLSRDGAGDASADLLGAVRGVLNSDNVRPLTDHVIVRSGEIVSFEVRATIYVYQGPDSAIVVETARAAARDYVASIHRLGFDVSVSGIYAALHQPGVQRVELESPAADIIIGPQQASYATAIDLTFGGRDE